jgi:hypothetical protein
MTKGNRNLGRRVKAEDKDKPQKPAMVRQELYLRPDQKEALKKLSEAEVEDLPSVGEIIREAIDKFLKIKG